MGSGDSIKTDIDHNVARKKLYFVNEIVEWDLTNYIWSGCTDVALRDKIMDNAPELIRQIIRKQGLHTIYPGQEESAFGDLLQTAWMQLERTLYKYRSRPYCRLCYSPDRPSESILYHPQDREYGIKTFQEVVEMHRGVCPRCSGKLTHKHIIEPQQGRFGGSEAILYRGMSKVFNMWCVAPETLLISNTGVMPIRDVVADQVPFVYGAYGFKPVNGYLSKPEQDCYKLTTKYGFQITTSPEHRLQCLTVDGPQWKEVQNIQVGDKLGIQFDQQVFFNEDYITYNSEGDWSPPIKFTEDLAYIIGLFISSGEYSRTQLSIATTNSDMVDRLLHNFIGVEFTQEDGRVVTHNTQFIDFIKWLGFGEQFTTRFIPRRLLQTSKNILANVISGIIDNGGSIDVPDGTTRYCTASQILSNQLQILLLNFGILAELSVLVDNSYCLTIYPEYAVRFFQDITFRTDIAPCGHYGPLLDLRDQFQQLYYKYGCDDYSKIEPVLMSDTSLEMAEECLELWADQSHDPAYQFIADRIAERQDVVNKVIWMSVRRKEDVRSELREISVDSEDHSYIANGFISHNSQITRTVILAYIKKEGRDRRNSSSYSSHLSNKHRPMSEAMERFLAEARELCRYNDDYLLVVDVLENIAKTDDRPYDGIISKLVNQTGLSRTVITNFTRHIKLRSMEFTDSPINRGSMTDNMLDNRRGAYDFDDEF